MQIALKSLRKHFIKWANLNLLYFALFSKEPTDHVVAQILLSHHNYSGPETFTSSEHKTTIHLNNFFNFLKEICSKENKQNVLENAHIAKSRAEIILIANGANIWDSSQDNRPLGLFREQFKRCAGGQGSNAQMTKRGVNESGYVTLGRCDKCSRSNLARA